MVALLAEGVDRNNSFKSIGESVAKSPSSRRAWIEIFAVYVILCAPSVALLAEGVDRNSVDASGKSMMESRPPRGGRG